MTSSSEPRLRATAEVALTGATTVRDPHRATEVAVVPEDARLLAELIAAGRGGRPWTAADDPGTLARLCDLGLVSLDLGRGAWWRSLVDAIRTGDDRRLRAVRRLQAARVPVPVGAPAVGTAVRVVVVAYGAAAAALTLLALAAGALTGAGPGLLLHAAAAPWIFLLTVAVHEAAHLAAVRRAVRDPRSGAFVHGPWRLAVARPALAGRPLRLVAAAGPVAGTATSAVGGLVGATLGPDAAPLVLTGIVAACYHTANLVPWATDGRHVWTGRE